MRHKNEKKEVRFERIHTWDLLHEVDQLVEHVPGWKRFNWDASVKLLYIDGYKNQFESKNRRASKKIK